MEWITAACASLNESARVAALARQEQLTKPPGALARLEEIAVQLAAMQGVEKPQVQRIHISVFAADHGVAAEGVSLFPQAVTAEMVRNFARGGAAISVLARQLGATLEVINLGTVAPVEALPGVYDQRIAAGTANFTQAPAMTEAQLAQALQAGQAALLRAKQSGAQVFIAGEMGIANTTAATAIACALTQTPPAWMSGAGTGLTEQGIVHKAQVIQTALDLHRLRPDRPLAVLQHVGGFEIAAMCGAYVAAAQAGLPILVDGFIATAAALAAVRINPGVRQWLMFAHTSAEQGHQRILAALEAKPLLLLGMRLGEGSGAAMAVPMLQLACALHNEMATFAEAAVSEKA